MEDHFLMTSAARFSDEKIGFKYLGQHNKLIVHFIKETPYPMIDFKPILISVKCREQIEARSCHSHRVDAIDCCLP